MEENLLLRRFIFFQKDEHFDESVQSFLLENNPEAIVFIADTKTIWTHGVRFNASAVKDYAEGISDRVDEINTSIQNLHEDISGELQDILNQWGGPEELNQAIEDANSRLASAEARIKELEDNPYDSTQDTELQGLIRNAITGATEGLVQWKESLTADDGLFKKLVTYDNIVDKTSTIYQQILDIVKSAYTQQIQTTNIDGKVRTAVTEAMQTYTNGDAYYKDTIQQWKEGLEDSVETCLSDLDGIAKWKASVTRNINGVDAILSALQLEINENNIPSWQLTAATSDETNPIYAAIKGWVENNKSNILVDADNITFNGEHTSFNNTVMDVIGETYWKGNDDDILTLVNNAGIKITNNDNSIELKLPVGDSSWQGGLRHIKDDGRTISEGSFVLNIDGSGHIGGKMKSGEYPVVWDEDGNLFINANTITTNTDPDGNNESGVIDFSKVGGYTIRVYTTTLKSSPITPLKPDVYQTLREGADNLNVHGQTWYRMLSDANATDRDNIWMSTREVNKDGSIIEDENGNVDRNYIWSDPILLTAKDGKDGQDGYDGIDGKDGLPGPQGPQGPEGKPGEDGIAIKYVFIHSKTQTFAKDATDANVDYKYVPNPPTKVLRDVDYQNTVGNGWVDDAFQEAASLNDTYQYVWMSFSNTIEKDENGLEWYTNWSDPVIWSRWGRNGTDGGGVEYIFYQGPAAKNWDVAGSEDPRTWESLGGSNFQQDQYIHPQYADVWSQDPKNITVQGNANWVSIRRQVKNPDGKLIWQSYVKPTIWAYFAVDGKAEAAYTMDWTNDQLVVSVDQDGYVKGTGYTDSQTNKTVYEGFTGYSKMQVWDPSGRVINSFADRSGSTDDYFKLSDSAVIDFIAGSRPSGQNWYNYEYGSFANVANGWREEDGAWMKIHIIDYDQYTDSQPLDPAFVYTKPQNIKNKHLYIPVTVTIYDGTNNTPKYSRDVMINVFGVYTGVDGAAGAPGRSIELKTSHSYVKKNSSNQITPSSIGVWAIIGEGLNGIDKIYPGDGTFTFDYKDYDDDNYTPLNNREIYTANITSYPLEVRLLYDGTVIDVETIQLIEDGQNGQNGQPGTNGLDGADGENGQSVMYSYIYTRTNQTGLVSPSQKYMETNDLTGTLGTFLNPNPTGDYAKVYRHDPGQAAYVEIEGAKWYDSIPYGSETLWESRAIFTSDGELPQVQYDEGAEDYLLWSTPAIVVDTDEIDIEFSPNETFTQEQRLGDNETVDKKQAKGWYDPGTISALQWSTMVWRAERRKKNGHHVGSWMYMKIKGEKGDAGQDGLNGSSIRFDLDNQTDQILCNSDGEVVDDVILSTTARLYSDTEASGLIALNEDTLSVNAPEITITRPNGQYTITPTVAYKNGFATISYDFKRGDVLPSKRISAQISIEYNRVTYSSVFTILAVSEGKLFNLVISPSAVSFVADNNDEYKPDQQQILCWLTKRENGLPVYVPYTEEGYNFGEDSENVSFVEETGLDIYVRFNTANNTSNWEKWKDKFINEQSERYIYLYSSSECTSIDFALSDANIDLEHNQNAVRTTCVDFETVPVVYSGKRGPEGPQGPKGDSNILKITSITDYYRIHNINNYNYEYESETAINQSADWKTTRIAPTIQQPYLYKLTVTKYSDGSEHAEGPVIVETWVSTENKIYYPAGIYNGDAEYGWEDNQIPYVQYKADKNDPFRYYYLSSAEKGPKKRAIPGSNNDWTLMHHMTPIMTDAVIADYAKLNSAVFASSWMYSQGGFSKSSNKNYTNFDPEHPTDEYKFIPNFAVDFSTGSIYAKNLTIDSATFNNVAATEGANLIEVTDIRYYPAFCCKDDSRSKSYPYSPLKKIDNKWTNIIPCSSMQMKLYKNGFLYKRISINGIPVPPNESISGNRGQVRAYHTTEDNRTVWHYRLYEDVIAAVKEYLPSLYPNEQSGFYGDDDIVYVHLPDTMYYAKSNITDATLTGDDIDENISHVSHVMLGTPIGIVYASYRWGDVNEATVYNDNDKTEDDYDTWQDYYDDITPNWRTDSDIEFKTNNSRPDMINFG